MKLSEIVAKLTGLESRVAAQDAEQIKNLKAQIDGQVAQLTADLAAAQGEKLAVETKLADAEKQVAELSAAVTGFNTNLNDALAALKIESQADATASEKITLMQTAISAAIAKVGVKPSEIPAGSQAQAKTIVFSEFNKLSAAEKEKFLRSGGKLQ